jgi:hypothetical protein
MLALMPERNFSTVSMVEMMGLDINAGVFEPIIF